MRSEFGFIQHLKDHFNLSRVGDDCAVIPKDENTEFLITSDLLVEDIDFRLEWSSPKFIGHKALAVSLSDIAAMGGSPVYCMVSIAVPQAHWDSGFPDGFYAGFMELAGRAGVELIGGDISRTSDKITIDSTVIGEIPFGKAIKRSGAKPGDHIFISGTLGGASGGLKILESGGRYGAGLETWQTPLVLQQLKPYPLNGQFLVEFATSAIDISDGISSDLKHICDSSGVGARIYSENLPIDANLSGLGLSPEEVFELALHGGEDFQLLFTAAPEVTSKRNNFPFKAIGEITGDPHTIELIVDGSAVSLEPKAFRHF